MFLRRGFITIEDLIDTGIDIWGNVRNGNGEGLVGAAAIVIGHGEGDGVDPIVCEGVGGFEGASLGDPVAEVPHHLMGVEATRIGEVTVEAKGSTFVDREVAASIDDRGGVGNGDRLGLSGDRARSIGDGEGGGVAAVVGKGMGYGFSADRFVPSPKFQR